MVVVMTPEATDAEIDAVAERVRANGGEAFVSRGTVHTIIGLVGDTERFKAIDWRQMHGVDHVIQIGKPYKMVSRDLHPETTVVKVGTVPVGRDTFTLQNGGQFPHNLHIEGNGIAIDVKRKLLFVSSWGNASNYKMAGTGKFYPPSITVYPLDANGDIAPLRVIQGPKPNSIGQAVWLWSPTVDTCMWRMTRGIPFLSLKKPITETYSRRAY